MIEYQGLFLEGRHIELDSFVIKMSFYTSFNNVCHLLPIQTISITIKSNINEDFYIMLFVYIIGGILRSDTTWVIQAILQL